MERYRTSPRPLIFRASTTPFTRWAFALVVTEQRIYVGYYDAARQLSVASRPRGSAGWAYTKLPSWVGWDSHNSIAMAVDAAGQLHVAANMHNDPLVYFRTSAAGDVRTLARAGVMADAARLLTYKAAAMKDGNADSLAFRRAASVAKLYATESAVTATRIATQVFGGYGFMEEYPVARFYRDAKILEIGEGTSEVQRMVIARGLGLPVA